MKTFTLPEIINFLSNKKLTLYARNNLLRNMTIEMIDNGTAIVEDAAWADTWRTKHPEYYPLTFKKQSWSYMSGYFEVIDNQLKLSIRVYEQDMFYNEGQKIVANYHLTINDTHPTIQELVEQKISDIASETITNQDEEKARKRQQAMEQSIIDNFI
jgi:hypothetical protein